MSRNHAGANEVQLEDVLVLRKTDKAILVEVDTAQIWIPKSQISENSEVWKDGQTGALIIPEWLATAKGLI